MNSPRSAGRGIGGRHTLDLHGPPDPHRRVPDAHDHPRRPDRRADRRPAPRAEPAGRAQAGEQTADAGPDGRRSAQLDRRRVRPAAPSPDLVSRGDGETRPVPGAAPAPGGGAHHRSGQPGCHRRAADHGGRSGPGARQDPTGGAAERQQPLRHRGGAGGRRRPRPRGLSAATGPERGRERGTRRRPDEPTGRSPPTDPGVGAGRPLAAAGLRRWCPAPPLVLGPRRPMA